MRDYTEGSRRLSSAAKEQALHSLDAIKERLGGQKLAEVKRLAELNHSSLLWFRFCWPITMTRSTLRL